MADEIKFDIWDSQNEIVLKAYEKDNYQCVYTGVKSNICYIFFSSNGVYYPDTGEVFMQPYKYFMNLIEMPIVLVVLLIGVVGVLFGIGKTVLSKTWRKGIWFAGAGTVLTVLALLLCAGWNNTAYYPSLADPQSSLTIQNSCSSPFTLKVMSYVSILVPFVLAYIFYAWRALDLHKINSKEMQGNGHTY